jgi:hypothetical protein
MYINKAPILGCALLLGLPAMNLQAAEVNITPDIESVTVKHGASDVSIMRNQNQKNTINPAFAKTSRKCPPFCIQPATLAPGVETIAELEMLHPGLGRERNHSRGDQYSLDQSQPGQGRRPDFDR